MELRKGGSKRISVCRKCENKRRFQILKLEERIAPHCNRGVAKKGHWHCDGR